MEDTKLKITPSAEKNAWLNQFFKLIFNSQLTEKEMSTITSKIITYYSTRNNFDNRKKFIFSEENKEKRFFNYLNSIKEKLAFEYLNEAIDISIINTKETDFIDNFVRYIVLTNLSDIEVSTGLSSEHKGFSAIASCTLGEYPLAGLELYVADDLVLFCGVEVNQNARRLGIGTRLFEEIMSDIHRLHPGKDLVAYTVFKDNIGAIEFYKSLGADLEESMFSQCYTARFKSAIIEKIYRKEK